jgi:hypothetical protein
VSYLHHFLSLPLPYIHFFSFFPRISTYVAGDIPDNVDVPPVAMEVHCGDAFRASNSVEL